MGFRMLQITGVPKNRTLMSLGALILCSIAALIMLLAFGCSKQQAAEGGSSLERLMRTVPLAFEERLIWYNDYLAAREQYDLGDMRGFQAILEQWEQGYARAVFNGLAWYQPFRDYRMKMGENVGFDDWDLDQVIWVDDSPWLFWAGTGPVTEGKVKGNLFDLGYKREDYKGVPYYALRADYTLDMRDRDKLGLAGLALNRVGFDDGTIVAASATEILEPAIDTLEQDSPSLWDNTPHRRLVEKMGEDMFSVAFLPPDWVPMRIKQFRGQEQIDALVAPYLEGKDAWGVLGPYVVAALGYQVVNDQGEIVLAIYYDDTDRASQDVGELEKRWNTYRFTLTYIEEVFSTASCKPLTTEVSRGDDYSVLVAKCPVDRENSEPEGPSLWHKMVSTGDVLLLVPDLQHLRD